MTILVFVLLLAISSTQAAIVARPHPSPFVAAPVIATTPPIFLQGVDAVVVPNPLVPTELEEPSWSEGSAIISSTSRLHCPVECSHISSRSRCLRLICRGCLECLSPPSPIAPQEDDLSGRDNRDRNDGFRDRRDRRGFDQGGFRRPNFDRNNGFHNDGRNDRRNDGFRNDRRNDGFRNDRRNDGFRGNNGGGIFPGFRLAFG